MCKKRITGRRSYTIGFFKRWSSVSLPSICDHCRKDCVLFTGNEKDALLYLVGGAVRLGETAQDAVYRRIFEETGVRYEIEWFAVIHENSFNGSGDNLQGVSWHKTILMTGLSIS